MSPRPAENSGRSRRGTTGKVVDYKRLASIGVDSQDSALDDESAPLTESHENQEEEEVEDDADASASAAEDKSGHSDAGTGDEPGGESEAMEDDEEDKSDDLKLSGKGSPELFREAQARLMGRGLKAWTREECEIVLDEVHEYTPFAPSDGPQPSTKSKLWEYVYQRIEIQKFDAFRKGLVKYHQQLTRAKKKNEGKPRSQWTSMPKEPKAITAGSFRNRILDVVALYRRAISVAKTETGGAGVLGSEWEPALQRLAQISESMTEYEERIAVAAANKKAKAEERRATESRMGLGIGPDGKEHGDKKTAKTKTDRDAERFLARLNELSPEKSKQHKELVDLTKTSFAQQQDQHNKQLELAEKHLELLERQEKRAKEEAAFSRRFDELRMEMTAKLLGDMTDKMLAAISKMNESNHDSSKKRKKKHGRKRTRETSEDMGVDENMDEETMDEETLDEINDKANANNNEVSSRSGHRGSRTSGRRKAPRVSIEH